MSEDKERFLERWSRRKQAQRAAPEAPAPVERLPAPGARGAAGGSLAAELPPPEALSPDSDFAAYMGPKVADALRRAALKKLFAHPEINVADPFEPFSGDWRTVEAIPDEMLDRLRQARAALRDHAQANVEPPPADDAEPRERAHDEEEARKDGESEGKDA